MSPSITVVVIDSDVDSLKDIVKYITNFDGHAIVEGTAVTFEKGYELIHQKRPMVVIMDVDKDINLSIERIKTILNRFPQVSIFATSSDKSADTILKVMRAGATEYILKPVAETDLVLALQKLGRLWVGKPAPEEQFGKVYTFFSPKAGVGVTTTAVNYAVNLYKQTNEPTIIVDFDLIGGDVSTFLNIRPSYTISDVTTNITRLDKSFLSGIIVKHKSGIHVLAEPARIADGITIKGPDVKRLLGFLRTMYKHIVIDTEPSLTQTTRTVFENSDILFLIFVLSLPSIKNVSKHLEYFKSIGLNKEKIRLIVNRYVKKSDIKIEDAEKVLDSSIFYSLPNEFETTMDSINKGVPIDEIDSKSRLNLAIKEMVKMVETKK